ncbi:hypothetical protein MKEN_00528500 [Mycena kentingensis (nom. inval.)]|nr:hypothetical protein MKEN_00528500 [Mycena kentingensis (nom. inval.)]
MDAHYKLLRAVEERLRLNVEIKRLVTYMRGEERFLVYKERELEAKGLLARAVQVRKLRMVQGRFSAVHMQRRLQKLSKLPGFTGCILPGEGTSEERRVPEGFSMAVSFTAVALPEVLTTADGSTDGLTAENVEGVTAEAEAAVSEDSDKDGELDEEHLELADDPLEAIAPKFTDLENRAILGCMADNKLTDYNGPGWKLQFWTKSVTAVAAAQVDGGPECTVTQIQARVQTDTSRIFQYALTFADRLRPAPAARGSRRVSLPSGFTCLFPDARKLPQSA